MKSARILAVGGSDSGGGAGIEADIKTITVLGGYAMTAITAVTVQDTEKLWAIQPMAPHIVRLAIEVAFRDIGVDAVKIGMLGEAAFLTEVTAALPADVPVIVDPVLVSTSGTRLLPEAAMVALQEQLFPRATLVTPNLPEMAALTGMPVRSGAEIIQAAEVLLAMGAQAVLAKGGHASGAMVIDRLITSRGVKEFPHPRVATRHAHGTGCALASAIATGIGQGLSLQDAVLRAGRYVQIALENPPELGRGNGPIGHLAGIGL